MIMLSLVLPVDVSINYLMKFKMTKRQLNKWFWLAGKFAVLAKRPFSGLRIHQWMRLHEALDALGFKTTELKKINN